MKTMKAMTTSLRPVSQTMYGYRRRAAVLGLGLWLGLAPGCGCGGNGASGGQHTLGGGQHGSGGGSDTGDGDLPTLVRVSETGADADQAHALALAALEQQLLGAGNVSLSEYAGIPSWAPGVDLRLREDLPDGGVTITLGLSRERVIEFLDAIRMAPWQADAPAEWSAVLTGAMRARVENLVCERRRMLLDDQACEAPDLEAAVAAVGALAETVRLRSYYDGGVPLAQGGGFLRPISIVTELRSDAGWIPSANIPVVVAGETPDNGETGATGATGALRGQSDESGLVFLNAPADDNDGGGAWPNGAAHASVDRERMLGPLSSLWPERFTAIPLRPVSHTRFTLLDVERARGQEVDDAVFATAFAKAVKTGGRAALVAIKPLVARQLARLPAAELSATLPEYADIWEGLIDVVVRVEVESDYASRMGAHRLWYEARARVTLYDAWTGAEIQTFEDTATASGVGDERADQAARELLAERLHAKLFAAP